MALPTEITSQDIVSGNLLETVQGIVAACHNLADSLQVEINLIENVEPFDIVNENLVRVINQILAAVELLENAS